MVPGSDGPVTNAEQVKEFVAKYGCPVIVKAAYGGGGRGMRKIEREEDVRDFLIIFKLIHFFQIENAFNRAFSEAQAAFGDGSLFVEKYIL